MTEFENKTHQPAPPASAALARNAKRPRILIVGGVAGGASAATRARRLCEDCDIVMFERGPHVSFANCGLPYHVGDVIEDENALLIATPEFFAERFALDVRTQSEVVRIHPEEREVEVRDLRTGELYREGYDRLLLSPGAAPIVPNIPGKDLPGVLSLRNINDVRRVREAVEGALSGSRSATVVGGGFIGLELAENLRHRGLEVTLVELGSQLMPTLDREIAHGLRVRMEREGIVVKLDVAVSGIEKTSEAGDNEHTALRVLTNTGESWESDLLLFAAGVRAESQLAEQAGLRLGPKGGIAVDERMQTSNEHIWAVGDAVEVAMDGGLEWTGAPLAGPANRQGRFAAEAMVGRSRESFGKILGTSVIGVFDLTAARVGKGESALRKAGASFFVVHTHPKHHAGYYPGAQGMSLKLMVDSDSGRVLGAQAIGTQGVERRIDVIATAMKWGATVEQLAEVELCYAPQFGSAKDPVNQVAMLAENVVDGHLSIQDWATAGERLKEGALLLDVRSEQEVSDDSVPGALHIPLGELRTRLNEVEASEVLVMCQSGQRAYLASRILTQRGIVNHLLSGGMKTYTMLRDAGAIEPLVAQLPAGNRRQKETCCHAS